MIFFMFVVNFETYGCQMNVNDTEIAWTFLKQNGFKLAPNINEVYISVLFPENFVSKNKK